MRVENHAGSRFLNAFDFTQNYFIIYLFLDSSKALNRKMLIFTFVMNNLISSQGAEALEWMDGNQHISRS